MSKIVGRRPIELKLSDQLNGYIPVFNSSSRLWGTISKNDFITGSAITSGSNLFVGDQTISGSLTVTQGITGSLFGNITGSLFGTASYADNAWAIGGNTFSGSLSDRILGTLSDHHLSIYTSGSRVATFTKAGSFILSAFPPNSITNEKVLIEGGYTSLYNLIKATSYIDNYSQFNIQNLFSGSNASSDVVATADNGTESANFIDMGINSSTFTGSVGDANDAYLYSTGNDLHIGNASNYPVQFFAGGIDNITNRKLQLNPNNLHQMTGSLDVSGSVVAQSFTGSLQGSSSYALTSSYADNFTVAGTLTAQTIIAQTITSSVEFITGSTRNGSLLTNTHQFTGSVSITGSLEVNGRNYINDSSSFESRILTNSSSFASFSGSYINESASFATRITTNSSSFASFSGSYVSESSSFASRITTNSGSLASFSGSYVTESSSFASRITTNSSSFAIFSGSYTNESSSFASRITTNSASISSLSASFATFSGSFNTGSFTGSFVGSLTGTASYAAQALTASNANTASSADDFTVRGTLTAQKIVAQTITSSTEFITGSTKFGSLLTDTHQFTGSVGITGSLTVAGNISSSVNNTYTIGTPSNRFANIYSAATIYGSTIRGTQLVFGDETGNNYLKIFPSPGNIAVSNLISPTDNGYRLQVNGAGSASGSLFVSGSSLFSGSVRSTNGFTGSFSGSLYNLQNSIVGHIPFFSSSQVLSDSIAMQLDNGSGSYSIAINQNNITTAAPEALYVYQPSATSYNVITGKGNLNNYLQLNIQNTNTGASASSDVVATANNGNESTYYVDMGINSDGYVNNGNGVGNANDAYLYSTGNNIHIGNASAAKSINFFAGGFDVVTNKKFQLNPNNLHQMTGSLDVSGSIVARSFTGSLQGTSSVAVSSSYAVSASYAVTASLAINANNAANASTASYVLQAQSASYWSGSIINAATASYVLNAQSASYWSGSIINAATASYVLNAQSASYVENAQTASYVLQAISASFATSASYWSGSIINAATASYVLNAVSASYATSASFIAGISDGTASLAISSSYAATASSADNFLVRGTLTAQTINVQTITSSIDFVTGSSRFGSATDNTHQFTGSVSISGSLAVNNSSVILTNQTSSMSVSTASYSANADLLDGKDSTTFATTGSNVFVGSQTISGSILTKYNSYEIHVNGVDGNDTTGDGTLLNPVKTITKALTLISAARLTIILHPGTYAESPTITATNTTIFATGINGGNTHISGTLTINAAARISGIKITNLVVNTSESVYIASCVVDTSLTKSGSGYTEFNSGEYQCVSGINISGAGTVAFTGVKLYFINVNNSSASVILKGCTQILSPTVTSGSLAIADSVVVALTATGSAITTYPNSVITLANSQVLVPTGDNVARVSFSGFYSILNAVYDKNNSTLASLSATGGSTSAISFFQDINLQSTTITGSLNITGSTVQKGNNTLSGNTVISGSLTVSGSTPGGGTNINIYGDTSVNGAIKFLPISENIDTSVSASYIFVSGSTQDLYFSQNTKGFSNVTRLRWLEGNLYTGLLSGGLITTQSSTIYKISSGSGVIVNLNASINQDPYPVVQYVSWNNLSASIAPSTGSYDQAFVGVDNTSNIYAQGTPFNSQQFDTLIPIGVVLHQNRSTINGVKTQPSVAYGSKQRQTIFAQAFGPLKLSGLTVNVSGSSTGSLIVTSGTAYADGANYTTDASNPSYITDPGTTVSKIFRYRQSGSAWVYDTNNGAGYGTIDPGQYSNNGVLASVANGEFSIQRVYWFPNSTTKAIVVYYGNAIYATAAEATLNVNIESFVEAPNTEANAVYLGALVLAGNANFTSNNYSIIPGGLFRGVSGAGGGGSAITTTLSGLSDVAISGPTNGQPLVYNTTAGKWVNQSTLTATLTGNASTATSASYAATSSYANNFTVAGTLTAQTIVAQTITSSIEFITGSTRNGSLLTNTHQFTGSVLMTGSLAVVGNQTLAGSLTLATDKSISINGGNAGFTGDNFGYFNNETVFANVYPFRWSSTTDKYGVKDLAIRRGSAGTLEIFDGITNGTYRDLVLRNITGSNATFNGTATIVSASLNYQQNLAVATGSFQTIVSAATGSFRSAFFDYVAYSASVVRAGTVVSTWSGSNTEYFENYTGDLGGSTAVVTLQTAISASNIVLQAGISGSAWSVRSLVRLL